MQESGFGVDSKSPCFVVSSTLGFAHYSTNNPVHAGCGASCVEQPKRDGSILSASLIGVLEVGQLCETPHTEAK